MDGTKQRTRWAVLGSALGVAVAFGLATGAGLALWIGRLNDWMAPRDVLVLAAYLGALYTAINAAGLGAAAAVLLVLGGRPGARVFAGLAAGFWVLLNGALRHASSVQLASVTPHLSAVGILDVVGVVGAAGLLSLGILTDRRRLRLASLSGALAVAVLLEGIHAAHEPPLVRDLDAFLAPVLAGTEASPVAPSPEPFRGARLLVVAYDGLSWEVLQPMLRRGDAPNFRAFLEGAAYGNLATHPFTKSPLIWESMATGLPPERHGIGHHAHFEVPGLPERIDHLPYFPLTNSPMAIRRFLTLSARFAPWRVVAADATDARAARFWDVASRAGLRSGIYHWMNTTPAPPIEGFVYGYGDVQPIAHPADLEEGLTPVLSDSYPVAGERWVEESEASERSHYQRFVQLALRYRPELLVYYTHFGDAVNHLNWRDETFGPRLLISGLRHPDFEPGPSVTRVMHFLDEMLGDLLSRVGPETSVVLVSDHGFDFRGYEHDNGPPGVLVVRGPGIRPGPFPDADIYDVGPTLLHLLGLPVAGDMAGAAVDLARPGGPLDRPVARVDSHGPATPPLPPGESVEEHLEKHREYLRALGYVN